MNDEHRPEENLTEVDYEAEEFRAAPAYHAEPVATPESPEADSVPVTGLDAVDRVLAREAAVSALPVEDRAAAYQALHDELEHILNQRPGSLPTELTGP